jgi:hypothetical protein
MGNIFAACSECEKPKYTTVDNSDVPVIATAIMAEKSSPPKLLLSDIDLQSPVFEGSVILRKFTRTKKYEFRFMWVNYETGTIHMSMYNVKDRRHKEASLGDVSSILKGAPNIADETVGKSSCCLTINFQKDSGIDLCFTTEIECDLWYTVLSRIIKSMKQSYPLPDGHS